MTRARALVPGAQGTLRSVALAFLLIASCGFASAQSRVDWSALSASQRGALAPLERDWSTIPPGQQQKWVEIANRHPGLPPADKAKLTQRMTEWSRLPTQERAQARLNYQEARQVNPEERQQQWQSYRALPADERRAFAARAQPHAASAPRATPEARPAAKSNVVRAPTPTPAQPVGATVVQRGAGATTNLVSKPTTPPLHQQAGLPKLAATPGFVDSATLLPQRGAQGAAVRSTKPSPEGPKNPTP